MFEGIEKKLEEVIKISDSCPDKYSVKCFQVLLEHSLQMSKNDNGLELKAAATGEAAALAAATLPPQRGFEEKDFHLNFNFNYQV
jgi:hypothetical protein